eukprot:457202_1
MNALRAQVLNLNLNLHVMKHSKYYRQQNKQQNGHIQFINCSEQCCEENNSGKCEYDNKLETIKHFIIDCNKYQVPRNDLISTITPYYQYYQIPIQLKTLLFVPQFYKNNNNQTKEIRW